MARAGQGISSAAMLDSWPRVIAFSVFAVFVQVLFGGIRPVDGGVLAQFGRDGFAAQLMPFSQYLFDSPLKIALLHGLSLHSPAVIAVVFGGLSLLPFLAVMLAHEREMRLDALLVLAVLPLTRVSFGWLGVGDALLVALVVAVVLSQSRLVLGLGSMLGVGWHLQQGAVALAVLAIVMFFRGDAADRKKLPYLGMGLVAGILLVVLVKLWIVPQHQGRAEFLLKYIDRFALRMLFYWPVAVAIVLPGLLALWLTRGLAGLHWSFWGSLAGAVALSAVTSDVSRVIFVLSFPAIFFLLLSARPADRASVRRLSVLVPVLALSAVLPLLSWNGVDAYDWKGLVNAMQKYWGDSASLDLFLKLSGAFD